MLPNAPAAYLRPPRDLPQLRQFCRAMRPAALATVQFSMVGATSRTIAFPLFTYSSRCRLFIDQSFFEQSWAAPITKTAAGMTTKGGKRTAEAVLCNLNFAST